MKKKKRICRQYIWKYKMSIYQGTYKRTLRIDRMRLLIINMRV